MTKFFSVRENFSFFHTVHCDAIIISAWILTFANLESQNMSFFKIFEFLAMKISINYQKLKFIASKIVKVAAVTVWKVQDFSVPTILCEINFGEYTGSD